MSEYIRAEKVKEVLDYLIESYRSDLSGVNIEPLFRDSLIINKTKEVWARIHKVSNLYKFLLRIDFIIEVYKDVWEALSDEGKRALVAHELRHIKVAFDKNGERILSLIPHDFEEFEEIINQYGFWKEDLKRLKEIVLNKEKIRGLKRKE